MCAAREPRRFNGLCDTCCWLGYLSCDYLLQRDRVYSNVPTFSSPPQNNRSGRGGTGYDLPISPSSYSGRSGGPGYDIPCSPPQYSGSHCYRAKPFVRHYSGGNGTALSPQQQPTPPSYSGCSGGPGYDIPCTPPQYSGSHGYRSKPFVRHYSGGDGTALSPQQQTAPRPLSSFDWDQRYNGSHSTAPQQQPGPRPFSSFGREQRYACHNRPPVNAGLANNIAQGQAQRDVGVDDRAEQQRPTTEIGCHGGTVPEVSGPPEATAPLARGELPLQARHQPSGTLSPPTTIISDSTFEQWLPSDDMKMPMFSLSEGSQQSAPTVVALAAVAPAAEAVTGTRVFPAASSKGVAEAPASSAGAASAAGPTAAPATSGTVFPSTGERGAQGDRFCRCNSGIDDGPGDRRYRSLRYISWGGTRIVSCSSSIGRNIGGGTGGQRYCSLRYISWGGTRIVSCSSSVGRNIGGGTGDQRYCTLARIN